MPRVNRSVAAKRAPEVERDQWALEGGECSDLRLVLQALHDILGKLAILLRRVVEARSAPHRARQGPMNPKGPKNLANEPRQSTTVARLLQVPTLTVALIVSVDPRSNAPILPTPQRRGTPDLERSP